MTSPFKTVGNHELVRCPECLLVFLTNDNTDPTTFFNDASNVDKSTEYWGFPAYYEKYKSVFNHFFEERLHRIDRERPELESVLDIGAGYGLWMNFCAERQLRTFGLDISRPAVDFARKSFHLDIECLDVSVTPFPKRPLFDCATLCDVVEHLPDPVHTLRKVGEHLRPHGLVYLQVPNEVQPGTYPLQKHWGLPHHLWHFTEQSLTKTLETAGFHVLQSWTGIQGLISAYEKGPPSLLQKSLWKAATWLKRGNRLQILAERRN